MQETKPAFLFQLYFIFHIKLLLITQAPHGPSDRLLIQGTDFGITQHMDPRNQFHIL